MPFLYKSQGAAVNGPFSVLKKAVAANDWVFDSIHATEASATLRASQLVVAPDNNYQAVVENAGTVFESA